ncbi:UDP-glycosyltransferase 74G1-like [Abrus precatorius]|uniref:Glycosyltransferase n=1 Tax=Abrus precatorius TaxID=3816 RepID=A0A8B8LQ61_ABRPR|nr:UDP-glycosyltransferase 74G1-like [Abrus precatorius]
MEEKNRGHFLVLAYPGQGHINPMLQFSKLLQHQGVRITLVTTLFYLKNLQKVPPSIALETISDGYDENGPNEAGSSKVYLDKFWQVGPKSFGDLLEKLGALGNHVDCVIYDSFFPWAVDVAKKFGIVATAYLTQNMAVNNIYYHLHLGELKAPLTQHEISLPMLPKLHHEDMPSFFFTYVEDPTLLNFVVDQFSNIHKADWILCNTFYELDIEIVDWITKIWPKFRTIGPNIPLKFLDKRYEDDQDYGVAEFKSEECIEWLDDKPKGSVVYVSFGSIAYFGEEQMKELAYALRECSNHFLWVVRASEEIKLPKDFEKKSEKGLVVTWCSQLKVLAHEAIGCFVTHCGWNSTLETLCLGVPTIGIPFWSDQNTNAKLMVDVWKMGIRAPMDENKIVRGEALKRCIREIMESERGKEMKSNAIQWKTLAAKAVSEGGSSYKNIIEFLSNLFPSHT